MSESEFTRMVKAAFDMIGDSQRDPTVDLFQAYSIYVKAFAAAKEQQRSKKPGHKTERAVACAFYYADAGYSWENAIKEIGKPNGYSMAVRNLIAFADAVVGCSESQHDNT